MKTCIEHMQLYIQRCINIYVCAKLCASMRTYINCHAEQHQTLRPKKLVTTNTKSPADTTGSPKCWWLHRAPSASLSPEFSNLDRMWDREDERLLSCLEFQYYCDPKYGKDPRFLSSSGPHRLTNLDPSPFLSTLTCSNMFTSQNSVVAQA